LRASWVERAAALGFDGRAAVDEARARAGSLPWDERRGTAAQLLGVIEELRASLGGLFRPADPLVDRGLARLRLSPADARAQHAVASAVRILGQREAAFGRDELARTALGLGLAGVTGERVDARIGQLLRDERLVPGISARIDGQVTDVTTPEAIAAEARILGGIERGRGAVEPIVPTADAVYRLNRAAGDRPLDAGQLAAATLALASKDRIVAVQGIAGAGKSTMISALARVAEGQGRRVIGLAFQNKMVGDLREGAGIEARTVSSFVNAYARHALSGRGGGYEAARESLLGTVVVVDESSMVATEPMLHLVGIANALGVDRLVLVGDRRQLSAIDAGKAFALAQAGGVALARMDENLRQRTDQLRTVAALANRGAAGEALGVLGDQVREGAGHVRAAAARWLTLPTNERAMTGVFASGRETRAELNRLIQEGLAAEGMLKGDGATLTVLDRVNLTREELRYSASYRAGMRLEVARDMPELGLARGGYEVQGIDAKGRIELERGGRHQRFDPQSIDPADKRDALGLVERQEVRLHEGDRIRWTQNDKGRGLDNAALARVIAVGERSISVETADRTILELGRGDQMLQRLGLAYALNMHMAQGVTVNRGIAVMTSTERHLSNQRLFNVTATRVRDALELYTDDKEKLARTLDRNPGDKTSALETIGRIEVDPRSGRAGERPFSPELRPELARAAAQDALSLRVGAAPKEAGAPLPAKGLELGL
jgi:ATP-dependent exoDNAse (exonuclease V) alpha subunit